METATAMYKRAHHDQTNRASVLTTVSIGAFHLWICTWFRVLAFLTSTQHGGMASFSSDGSVRCWICMRNGENRFFNGHAVRKVHEETVHAPRYSQDNNANADASYRWYTMGYASHTTNSNGKCVFPCTLNQLTLQPLSYEKKSRIEIENVNQNLTAMIISTNKMHFYFPS